MKIFAIDPGNIESGYAALTLPDFALHRFGKADNEELLKMILDGEFADCTDNAIEMIASYGMSVGKSVFDTCVWIGRFAQALGGKYTAVYRKDEKILLCGSMKAKDANIRQALIDRYAKFDGKSGKGTKKTPDVFYGVSKDAWSAIAVGVTYFEGMRNGKGKSNGNA